MTPCPLFNERRSPRPREVLSVGVGFCVRFICGVWASAEQRRRRNPHLRGVGSRSPRTSGSALRTNPPPGVPMSGLRPRARPPVRTQDPMPAKRHIDTSTGAAGARPSAAARAQIGTLWPARSTPKHQNEATGRCGAGGAGVPTASNAARVAGLRSRKVRRRVRAVERAVHSRRPHPIRIPVPTSRSSTSQTSCVTMLKPWLKHHTLSSGSVWYGQNLAPCVP
jgi:hypothetical protein